MFGRVFGLGRVGVFPTSSELVETHLRLHHSLPLRVSIWRGLMSPVLARDPDSPCVLVGIVFVFGRLCPVFQMPHWS